MAKRIEFQCDGCDKIEFAKPSRGYPTGWGDVKISVDGLSNPYVRLNDANGERSYDLCSSCQQRLYFNHDPRQWPRKVEGI
jgi:hypothetical protein